MQWRRERHCAPPSQVCGPLVAFLHGLKYSAVYSEGANFDRTNFQYLLRGLLVHLDDASAEIQQAANPARLGHQPRAPWPPTPRSLAGNPALLGWQPRAPQPGNLVFPQAVLRVLEEAVAVDAPVLADEVRAVRERHRSTKLCDALLQRAQACGQLV